MKKNSSAPQKRLTALSTLVSALETLIIIEVLRSVGLGADVAP